jgi:hypothetical protein
MKLSYTIYCRTLAVGHGHEARCARMCLSIGAPTGRKAIERTETAFASGAISRDTYEARIDAVQLIMEMHGRGQRMTLDPCEGSSGWDSLGEGKHVRRAYLCG